MFACTWLPALDATIERWQTTIIDTCEIARPVPRRRFPRPCLFPSLPFRNLLNPLTPFFTMSYSRIQSYRNNTWPFFTPDPDLCFWAQQPKSISHSPFSFFRSSRPRPPPNFFLFPLCDKPPSLLDSETCLLVIPTFGVPLFSQTPLTL